MFKYFIAFLFLCFYKTDVAIWALMMAIALDLRNHFEIMKDKKEEKDGE